MDVPRRSRADRFTAEERAITLAHAAVEALPADTRLTNAACKLLEARELVADFVDGIPFGRGYPRAAPAVDDRLRAAIEHVLSKWSNVEHAGTVMGGTEIARLILADVRSALNATNPSLVPPAVDREADTDPDELALRDARETQETIPDGRTA